MQKISHFWRNLVEYVCECCETFDLTVIHIRYSWIYYEAEPCRESRYPRESGSDLRAVYDSARLQLASTHLYRYLVAAARS